MREGGQFSCREGVSPGSRLTLGIKVRLGDLARQVEIKPTPRTALRIPTEASLLNPSTLRPLCQDFTAVVEQADSHPPAILLGEGVLPDSLRASLAERKASVVQLRASAAVAGAESDIGLIGQGDTNAALNRLIPVYRAAGMSPKEAADRFSDRLSQSYQGELRDAPRLLKRVSSFYKPTTLATMTRPARERDPVIDQVAERVAGRYQGPRASQRKETIKRLAAGILEWRDQVDAVRADASQAATWNYLYPYFRKNTAEGYFPLPSRVLQKIDKNYHRHLPILVKIGFLEPSPYGYSTKGTCKHYRINDGEFRQDSTGSENRASA